MSATVSRSNDDLPFPPRLREWSLLAYLTIWGWCVGLAVLTHSAMLFKTHQEGDEMVYYVLAERMGWDLSNYTTREDPRVRSFPYTIYQKPLFHHPPLYPLLLKLGLSWSGNPLLDIPYVATPTPPRGELSPFVPGAAVAMAFLVSVAMTSAGAYYAWRLMVLLEIPPALGGTAMLGIVLCPLVLFSTARVHHDGLAGLALFCGTVAFAEALSRNRIGIAIEAGLWLVAAFNLRFNSIVSLPLLLALPAYRLVGRNPRIESPAADLAENRAPTPDPFRAAWPIVAVVFGLLLTAGMQHYYRLFLTYGTISPGAMIQPTAEAVQASPFLKLVETRITRGWVLSELAMLFPLAALFAAPAFLKQLRTDLIERRWGAAFVILCGALFLLQLALSYKQLRYFAIASVFLHACWPYLFQTLFARGIRWNVVGLALATFLLMATTGFLNVNVRGPEQALLMPSGVFYWPPMMPKYQP